MFLAAFWHRIRWKKKSNLLFRCSQLSIDDNNAIVFFFCDISRPDFCDLSGWMYVRWKTVFEVWQENFLITVLLLKLCNLFKLMELAMLLVIMENIYLWKLTSLYRLYVGMLDLTSFILLAKWDKVFFPLTTMFMFLFTPGWKRSVLLLLE